MKTLTVTAARQNLGAWLKKALQGEDIGVMIDGAMVAFRPVKVYSEDYAAQEYGVTPEELDEFVQKASKELDADRKARRLKPFTGTLKRG
jgi:antitoxin (DNA-binding transcriptional repressor) of toxin-antitoxin stability system